MRLSGIGSLVVDGDENPVSYVIDITKQRGIISADGVLTGDFRILFKAFETGKAVPLTLDDGRQIIGIVSNANSVGSAVFRSSGDLVGF